MAVPDLDTSMFPLVISRFPPAWKPEELDEYFSRFRQLHEREQPFIHLSDISNAAGMSSSVMRKKAADFMAAEAKRSERLCKGAVQVAPSALMRGAITALHWLSPPPYPHAVVATFSEAVAWARARAKEAGLVIPLVGADAAQKVG